VPGSGCTYTLDASAAGTTPGSRQVRGQRRYLGLDAPQLVGAHQVSRLVVVGLRDGKLNIPENKNRCRPLTKRAGRSTSSCACNSQGGKAGRMVHHKIHDFKYTQLSTGPHEDAIGALPFPNSTAATLEPGGQRRQAARIWKEIDKAFADNASTPASAPGPPAQANPRSSPPNTDGGGRITTDRTCRRLLLGCERSSTSHTGKATYKGFHHQGVVLQEVNADGTTTRHAHVDRPGRYPGRGRRLPLPPICQRRRTPWRHPQEIAESGGHLLQPDRRKYRYAVQHAGQGYPWGSTSFVLTNALIMGLAYDSPTR